MGLVPPETRAARTEEMKEIADFARLLDCRRGRPASGLRAARPRDPLYSDADRVTRDLCDHCRGHGQALHLETGQETADALLQFIGRRRARQSVHQFRPGEHDSLRLGRADRGAEKVGRYVRSVHCKDGTWAARPGQEWGAEVPLGEGDVGLERLLRTLDEIGYTGPLTIEREIPQEPERQKAEIGRALRLAGRLKRRRSDSPVNSAFLDGCFLEAVTSSAGR